MNEEATIQNVINQFKKHIPKGRIIVYDNNSKDKTVDYSKKCGVEVENEKRRGKEMLLKGCFLIRSIQTIS